MSPLAHAVTTALFAFVWQGAAVGLALAVVLALLSRRSASSRYLACTVAMGILAVLPAITGWLAYSNPASYPTTPALASGFGVDLFAFVLPRVPQRELALRGDLGFTLLNDPLRDRDVAAGREVGAVRHAGPDDRRPARPPGHGDPVARGARQCRLDLFDRKCHAFAQGDGRGVMVDSDR